VEDEASRSPRQAEIEKQLKRLGATYYALELWGNEQETYRFHCRVAYDEQAHSTRHFEATSTDPITAMEKVLCYVEALNEPR
jgi:hypothetical protein